MQMVGFRLSSTTRENFYWGGSVDLGERSEYPLVVNDNDPRFAYALQVREQEYNLERLEEARKTKKRLLRNLIPGQFHYLPETSEEAWTTDYSPEDDGLLNYIAVRRKVGVRAVAQTQSGP